MLGTPYQTKLTFLANLLTILRILLQWKLDYDIEVGSACDDQVTTFTPCFFFRIIGVQSGFIKGF